MDYTLAALQDKLYEMYPELMKNHISMGVSFDESRNSWVIRFEKGGHSRYAFLDKRDADACMEGIQCLYLGALIDQYVIDLEKELGIVP